MHDARLGNQLCCGGCRFKEATGKSVERLEREKADRENLEMTNQAQVCIRLSQNRGTKQARADQFCSIIHGCEWH